MSIYDKSSLVLIPSGTKTGKVYSQKPTNGDGDFTFTRSSAATRVNADGNIEKETGNLILQSNTFSNAAWNPTNVTNIINKIQIHVAQHVAKVWIGWKENLPAPFGAIPEHFIHGPKIIKNK